ncbi:MAG: hypothetical protein HN348_05510, partial [Proteobacteria bacterium]|nr:hypothetical protein [Pseudomonadota bacterium]
MSEDQPSFEPTLYGRSMLRHFGWFHALLGFRYLFANLRFEEHSVENIRNANTTGTLVYVLYARSIVDYLALNAVLNRRRLPLAVWSNTSPMFFWQPLTSAWRDLAWRLRHWMKAGFAPNPLTSGWVAKTVATGQTIAVFLVEPPKWYQRLFGFEAPNPMEALLEAQEDSSRPIQLVPILIFWDRSPSTKVGQVRQFITGNNIVFGVANQLRNAWFRSRTAFVQAGEPVDLLQFNERVEKSRRARALHTLLRRFLRRESKVVRGPRLLPQRVMRRMVVHNPPMRALAKEEARTMGTTEEAVLAQMEKEYDSIAAHFKWWMIRLLYLILRPLWTRVFCGVDARPVDLARIRQAMRDGTAILIPCHKSHFDYVLLSWLFYEHDLIVPHVVAGVNLAIWPISYVLRSAGGFFIKRSFSKERIFPAVFSRYLRELIRQGYPVEFFIEGGRTRSGKLLPARPGVLGMVLEATEKRASGREVTLLPIALAYEQVAEEGAYARELGGEAKTPESMGQLVKARSVLRHRYGRVYFRVGEPIPCSQIVDKTDSTPSWSDRSRHDRKTSLARIGEKVLVHIGAATVILPTTLVALALLAHHRRGIRQDELLARINRFRQFLHRAGVEEAASFVHFDEAITRALDRFHRGGRLDSFEHEGARIWAIKPEERITLEFYKNQALHYFLDTGLAVCAIRGLATDDFC